MAEGCVTKRYCFCVVISRSTIFPWFYVVLSGYVQSHTYWNGHRVDRIDQVQGIGISLVVVSMWRLRSNPICRTISSPPSLLVRHRNHIGYVQSLKLSTGASDALVYRIQILGGEDCSSRSQLSLLHRRCMSTMDPNLLRQGRRVTWFWSLVCRSKPQGEDSLVFLSFCLSFFLMLSPCLSCYS